MKGRFEESKRIARFIVSFMVIFIAIVIVITISAYVFRCTVPESVLMKDDRLPTACKFQLALLYQAQKNEVGVNTAISITSSACKSALIDKMCNPKSEGYTALHVANCRAFHAK